MTNPDIRAAFEAWAQSPDGGRWEFESFARFEEGPQVGRYTNSRLEGEWQAYLAASLSNSVAADIDLGEDLPPLPEPIEVGGEGWCWEDFQSEITFSADHMTAYGRACIASRNNAATELPNLPEGKAWSSPLRHGSKISFPKPVKPDNWDDDEHDWFCHPYFDADQMRAYGQQCAEAARHVPAVAVRPWETRMQEYFAQGSVKMRTPASFMADEIIDLRAALAATAAPVLGDAITDKQRIDHIEEWSANNKARNMHWNTFCFDVDSSVREQLDAAILAATNRSQP